MKIKDKFATSDVLVDDGYPDMLAPTDEASAIPKPADIDEFHAEKSFKAGMAEQPPLHISKSCEEEEPWVRQAAESKVEAAHARATAARKEAEAIKLGMTLAALLAALHGYLRPAAQSQRAKWIWTALILGGDGVGFAGAVILLGDNPYYAAIQAVSVAACAVVAGMVGHEARLWNDRVVRSRVAGSIPDEAKPYEHFFQAPEAASFALKVLVPMTLAIGVLIATGVTIVRMQALGLGVGIAYGCFSLAMPIASFVNNYMATQCEICDVVERQTGAKRNAETDAAAAAGHPAIKSHDVALSMIAKIREGNVSAGKGAVFGVERRMHKFLNDNPGVAGNGTAAKSQSPPSAEPVNKVVGDRTAGRSNGDNGHGPVIKLSDEDVDELVRANNGHGSPREGGEAK